MLHEMRVDDDPQVIALTKKVKAEHSLVVLKRVHDKLLQDFIIIFINAY